MASVVEIEAGGERLLLLAQRAAWLPAHATLLVADVHLGKAAAFRRHGLPVPEATTGGTLQRLDIALEATQARRIVFLGDLLHAAAGRSATTLATVARWRERHRDLALTLVRGNHDRQAGDPPPEWAVACVDEPLRLGALALAHHPTPRDEGYVVAGHLHPAAVVSARGQPGVLRLACFHFGPRVGVLPAFGDFTGMQVLPRGPGDQVVVVADGELRRLPPSPPSRASPLPL